VVNPAYSEASRVAADRLVAAHHYLCRRGARKFWRSGMERCDLEQVAALGLIKASRRFDRDGRTPFEAYAWMSIVGELMHYVRDYERVVRVPRRLSELAREMGVLEATVAEARRARASAATLPLDDAGARALVCESGGIAPEDRMLVEAALARLGQTERWVIVGIYLLGLTQHEIAQGLGVSARRVSRIRHAALTRMQTAWVS